MSKSILITGAAGSIGSEICRQLTTEQYFLILFDKAETPLWDLSLELKEDYNFHNFVIVLGDITNWGDLDFVFNKYYPDVVFHVAAYKHVPLMEAQPRRAVLNNIYGSRLLADMASEYGIEKFVYISSDKAVNPTNVMGCSKRIAEMYIQSLDSTTKYITTRFGNVLESSGSVIPRWKMQIAKKRPLTVTHPDVTRFFMSIPEAAELVIDAYQMGEGKDVFVFDMGEPVRVADYARKLSENIVFTGLRPGEKLYEEVLRTTEGAKATDHEKIFTATVATVDYEWISSKIDNLVEDIYHKSQFHIVRQMKDIVPEYKSKNSTYEVLDNINDDLGCPI